MPDRSDIANDVEWNVCSLEVWQTCFRLAVRAADDPTSLGALRTELLQAELAGEISEFYAIGVQAILFLANDPEAATCYLGMAESVAGSVTECAVMMQWRALHQQVAAERDRGRVGGGAALLAERTLTLDDGALAALCGMLLETLRQASRDAAACN